MNLRTDPSLSKNRLPLEQDVIAEHADRVRILGQVRRAEVDVLALQVRVRQLRSLEPRELPRLSAAVVRVQLVELLVEPRRPVLRGQREPQHAGRGHEALFAFLPNVLQGGSSSNRTMSTASNWKWSWDMP